MVISALSVCYMTESGFSIFEFDATSNAEVKRVILGEKNFKWKLYNEVPEEYKIEFVAISKRLKFKDDVVVVVEPDPNGMNKEHNNNPKCICWRTEFRRFGLVWLVDV